MTPSDKSLDDRAIERRELDRRRYSFRTLLGAFFLYRRRSCRRQEEAVNSYTDWYGPWPLIATLIIILLCCLDAFFTLILLANGAVELNVFMDVLIKKDIQLFTIVKLAMTGIALLVLVMHVNFRIYRVIAVRYLIYAFVPIYMILIAHQINMLYQI
jgi:hypothetical protein